MRRRIRIKINDRCRYLLKLKVSLADKKIAQSSRPSGLPVDGRTDFIDIFANERQTISGAGHPVVKEFTREDGREVSFRQFEDQTARFQVVAYPTFHVR